MSSVSSSSSNKFINYLMKNSIRSCTPLVDKVKSLRAEINTSFDSLKVLIAKEQSGDLELIKTKFANNPEYITQVNKKYKQIEQESEESFSKSLENGESKALRWLLSNKNCLIDMVAHTEARVLDSFKNCVVTSVSEDGLSGCINSVESLLKDIT